MTTLLQPASPSLPIFEMTSATETTTSSNHSITFLPTTSSTHDLCLDDPFTLIKSLHETSRVAGYRAGQQTRGVGSHDEATNQRRHWDSPPGHLYLSFMLRVPALALGVDEEFVTGTRLKSLSTLLGAVLVKTLNELELRLPVSLKYPNDIFVAGQKAGGLLCALPNCSGASTVTGMSTVTGLLEQGPWISFSPDNVLTRHSQIYQIPSSHEVPLLVSVGLNLEGGKKYLNANQGFLRSNKNLIAEDPHRLGLYIAEKMSQFFGSSSNLRSLQAWFDARPQLIYGMYHQITDNEGSVSGTLVGVDLTEGNVLLSASNGNIESIQPRSIVIHL